MSSPPTLDPLASDPAREASASLRGYWAQIWRSVLAWLELADEERLFLEGAEDFDRIGVQEAEAVQVKDVAGPVTLRSQDVVDAIGHALDHRQRNRGRVVRYRFLATGGAGVERGAPFGAEMGGLQLWREARASSDPRLREASARQLADFLLADGKVSEPVKALIREASDAGLWSDLIAPIEWDLDAAGTAEVIQDVKDRLVLLGSQRGVSSEPAEAVAAHLYAHAYETATRQQDRTLTRAELLRLFDDKTRQNLPAALVDRMLVALAGHLPSTDSVAIAVGGAATAIGRPLPLPPRYFARTEVLDEVDRRLRRDGVLVLEGGTGVGKSTIAAGHLAASSETWGWVDLRGVDADALATTLDRVAVVLADEPGLSGLNLDDIAVPADARSLDGPLIRIKSALEARGGKLMITSVTPWPQRLRQALGLNSDGSMLTPALSRQEIERYLIERGCSPDGAAVWAAFIELHTQGHAQLVHARVATLEGQGFPDADLADLPMTPPDVIEARTEARGLVSTLQPPTRELIYRLSLMVGAFTRPQAIAIAHSPPVIQEPGLVLDGLVGPWLEVIVEGLYRVSPLLQSMGADVNGPEWTLAAHRNIGRTLATFRTVSPTDVSAILLHATSSRDWPTIARLAYGLLRADAETWVALADSISWFTLVGSGSAATYIDAEPFSRFLIRLLQYRVAAARGDSPLARRIFDLFDRELPSDTADGPLLMARYFFLATVLLRTEVTLPLSRFIDIGMEYIALSDRFATELAVAQSPELDWLIEGPGGKSDKAIVAGYSLTAHMHSRGDLDDLLDACNGRDETDLRRLLWFIGGRETTSGILLDRAWLSEGKVEQPDWTGCRATFARALELAQRLQLSGFAHASARAIVRLVSENLDDSTEAVRLADTFAAALGWSPGLENEKATVLLHAGQPREALDIWRRLLPTWTPRDDFDLQIIHSQRLAAIAAARLGLWAEAADWLGKAAASAEDDQDTFRAGLLIDAGFAHYKAGDNAAALDRLIEGASAIDRLSPDPVDRRAYTVRKRAGGTVVWIARVAAGDNAPGDIEPQPGFCSNLEVMDDPAIPSTPSDALWIHILEFEFAANLGDALFRDREDSLKATPYALLRMSFGLVRIRHRLRDPAIADLPQVAVDWAEALELCRIYYKEGGLGAADPLPPDTPALDPRSVAAELILTVLINAVFALTARDSLSASVIAAWRASAAGAGVLSMLGDWLDFLEKVLVTRTVDGGLVMRSPSVNWTWGIVGTIQVASAPSPDPADLITVHSYWVQALLPAKAGLFVLTDIESLVARGWLGVADQAFRLRNPSVTVPALRAACASSSTGWPKIGTILLAACDVIAAPIPAEMIGAFKRLLLD